MSVGLYLLICLLPSDRRLRAAVPGACLQKASPRLGPTSRRPSRARPKTRRGRPVAARLRPVSSGFREAHRRHRAGPKLRRCRGAHRFRGGGLLVVALGCFSRGASTSCISARCSSPRSPSYSCCRRYSGGSTRRAARGVSHVRLRSGEPAAHHHLRRVHHSETGCPPRRCMPAAIGPSLSMAVGSGLAEPGAGAFRRPRPLDRRHPALRGAAVGRARSGHAWQGRALASAGRRGTAEPRHSAAGRRVSAGGLLDRKRHSPHRKRATLFGCCRQREAGPA